LSYTHRKNASIIAILERMPTENENRILKRGLMLFPTSAEQARESGVAQLPTQRNIVSTYQT